ncbi:MAPEG family protein [Hyphomicrobiales bacterium BP6-180914]|uniref:MAPEG family protein n=1 Tax=Lichenifustis flavocetrariae TaxID=2949735 RepID=A0AA42CIP7_9HYPH|nr:MAPEG family protein [Lichenifustis flavocetrariae]
MLIAAIAGVSTPATVLAAQVYVAARLAHYLIYAAGIPVARIFTFLSSLHRRSVSGLMLPSA